MKDRKKQLALSLFLGIFSLWLTLKLVDLAGVWPQSFFSMLTSGFVWVALSGVAFYFSWETLFEYGDEKKYHMILFYFLAALLPILIGAFGLWIQSVRLGFIVDL